MSGLPYPTVELAQPSAPCCTLPRCSLVLTYRRICTICPQFDHDFFKGRASRTRVKNHQTGSLHRPKPQPPPYFVMALLASTYSEWLSLVTQFSNRIGNGLHTTTAQVLPKQSIIEFTAIKPIPRPRHFGSISIRLRSRGFSEYGSSRRALIVAEANSALSPDSRGSNGFKSDKMSAVSLVGASKASYVEKPHSTARSGSIIQNEIVPTSNRVVVVPDLVRTEN